MSFVLTVALVPGWTPPGGALPDRVPIVDTERSFVATETVETPGTPVTENSRNEVVDMIL